MEDYEKWTHIKLLKNDFKTAIIGFAIGDALGVPVEFYTREELKNKKVTDMREYGTHRQPKGTWSDDTSMTLATIDSINQNKEIKIEDIADKYVQWYKDGKYTTDGVCFDIGIGTKNSIENWLHSHTQPSGNSSLSNNGNGSLMRILPIAFYNYYKFDDYGDSIKIKCSIIKEYSSITHSHDISCFGCYLYSQYIGYILNGKDKFESYKLLKEKIKSLDLLHIYFQNCKKEYDRILKHNINKYSEDKIKSSGYVVDTLEAVFWTILNTNCYKDAVLTAVNLGDDTDTIGALVGGIAGILYGIDSIPVEWKQNLRKYEYISELCETFDKNLIKVKPFEGYENKDIKKCFEVFE